MNMDETDLIIINIKGKYINRITTKQNNNNKKFIFGIILKLEQPFLTTCQVLTKIFNCVLC